MIAAQCRAIEVALNELVGKSGYQTIGRSCGIFFYTTSLSPEQIQMLQKLELPPGIGPDKKMSLLSDRNHGPVSEAKQESFFQGAQKRKVAADLISQNDADWDLVFVSAHPPLADSLTTTVPAYFYYNNFLSSKQKQPVLVYVVDTGADAQLKEFQRQYSSNGQMVTENVIKEWIHAGPSESARADDWWSLSIGGDYDDDLGHGTCVAEKIGGLTKGVNKNPYLIMVRLEYQAPLHSVMLALEKITDHLLMRKQQGEDVRGNAVINLSLGYDDIGQVNIENMRPLLERLFNEFQAVIVVAAGNDAEEGDVEIQVHPAAFAKLPKFPIITVGGLSYTGERITRSRGGPGLTVSAPYFVSCMHERPPLRKEEVVEMRGTSFATPIISGVISAWLSDDELGPKLRGDLTNVPQRVKALVEELSYKRPGSTVAGVWNGIDADNPQNWPPEIPILSKKR